MEAAQLRFPTKLACGIGQAAEGLKNGAYGIFVLFYYNQVLGLSGTLAGLAIGIALVVDSICDPLAGSVSDHWRSKLGRRHPFLYAAIVPIAVSFYFLLAPPDGLGQVGLFTWLLIFSTLVRCAMTVYYVPHVALGAELTTNFNERTTVVGFRFFFGTFGGLLAAIIGFGFFFASSPEFPRGQFNHAAYPPYALVLAVLMALSIYATARGTQNQIPRLPQPTGPVEKLDWWGVVVRMMGETIDALRNPSRRERAEQAA